MSIALASGRSLSPDFRGQTAGMWNPKDLNESGLASLSMGYQIGVTPLQMAAAVSSVANGGTLYRAAAARRRHSQRPPRTGRAQGAAAHGLTRDCRDADRDHGSGRRTRHGDGGEDRRLHHRRQDRHCGANHRTAAYSDTEYHTSFVGFAPSRKPALTVIVVIDSPHGKVKAYGGTVAAPIFKRITEASLRHLRHRSDVERTAARAW